MRSSAALVLTAFLLASTWGLANPNEAPSLTVDRPINAIALATDAGSFAAVTDDESAATGDADASVWYYWDADGRNLRQAGPADPAGCGPLSADCTTDATHLAMDDGGDRMIVAGAIGAQSSVVVFVDTAAGAVHQETVDGLVQSVDLSADGRVAAVATSRSISDDGRLYRYSWGASVTGWSTDLPEPATHVAVSPDGTALAVAAGESLLRFGTAASPVVIDDAFTGTLRSLAIVDASRHLSIAGTSAGFFLLHSVDTSADQRILQYPHKSDPLTAVALAPDAGHILVGSAAGDVWLYRFDPVLQRVDNPDSPGSAIASWNVGAPVRDLAFAPDADVVVIAAGNNVTMHHVSARASQAFWVATLPGSIGQAEVTRDGERVIAASSRDSARTIHRFQALHEVTLAGANQITAEPATATQTTVTARNEGNRHAQLAWSADAPASWGIGLPADRLLFPGESQSAPVSVAVPAHYPPGTERITINATSSGRTTSQAMDVVVPEVRAWTLESGENPVSLPAAPGQATTFHLHLANEGNVNETAPVMWSVSDPAWNASWTNPAVIAPGAEGIIEIDVVAPEGAAEGESATISVSVLDEVIDLTATVGARFELDLSGPGGLQVDAGTTLGTQLTLLNEGNTVDGAKIEVLGVPAGWQITFGGLPSRVVPQMEAGEEVPVQVVVSVPADAVVDGPPKQVFFRATSLANSGVTSTTDILISVTAPPAAEPEPEPSQPTPPGLGVALLVSLAALASARRR